MKNLTEEINLKEVLDICLRPPFLIWLFVNIWGGIFLNPAPLLFLPLFLCYD